MLHTIAPLPAVFPDGDYAGLGGEMYGDAPTDAHGAQSPQQILSTDPREFMPADRYGRPSEDEAITTALRDIAQKLTDKKAE